MNTIAELLRTESDPKIIEKNYLYWKNEGKTHLFIDFSIAYANLTGLKVIIDLEGVHILSTPYSNCDEVSPIQIAALLGKQNQKFVVVHDFILKEIKASEPWERRKALLWIFSCNQFKKEAYFRLPKSMQRHLLENFL